MRPDNKDKQWGTIFLDASHESTMEKLDAMQAASRREQTQKRTEQEYMDKVRAKATERAKEILGEAYTERQKVLDEAKEDAERIRLEMQGQFAFAASEREEAQRTLEAAQEELRKAQAIREAAQEEGFNAGLEQAQQELESFRAAMGASVAGVLGAIHAQCGVIFEGWRQEMTELLKVCVEKGTGLVLDEQYPLVLEHLVLEAVRQLDDRRCITLRVHPDDEAAVADMFASARERLPNIGQWIVSGDPALQLGGLIAESQSGTVDSRLELHRDLVENILQHLVLPASSLEAEADRSVAEAVRQEAEKIALLAPPAPQPVAPQNNVLSEEGLDSVQSAPGMDSVLSAPGMDSVPPEAGIPTPEELAAVPHPLPEDAPALNDGQLDAALGLAEQQALAEQHAQAVSPTAPAAPMTPPAPVPPSAPVPDAAPPPPPIAAEPYAAPEADMPMQPRPEAAQNFPPVDDLEDPAVQTMPSPEAMPPHAASPEAPAQSHPESHMQAKAAPAPALEPTRDELEHELFDVSPSPQDEVLAQGGFLDSPAPGGERQS